MWSRGLNDNETLLLGHIDDINRGQRFRKPNRSRRGLPCTEGAMLPFDMINSIIVV